MADILTRILLLGIVVGPVVHGAYTVIGDDDDTCLYAMFDVNLYIYNTYNVTNKSMDAIPIRVPESSDKAIHVSGNCSDSYSLLLEWYNYTLILDFKKEKSTWSLIKIAFMFSPDIFNVSDNTIIEYSTKEQKLFNRTFNNDEYFYCDRCRSYYFSNTSGACDSSMCSYLTMEKTKIYLGNFVSDNPKKKLCREDWIAQREIIVPIAVGGFLVFLVMILILSYIGAFIKRKIKERGGYRPMTATH